MSRKAKGPIVSFVLSGCLCASLFLVGSGARAAKDPALVRAKQHFMDGQAHYLKKEYAKAAKSFMKAYEAKSYAAFLYNAAVANEKAKNYAVAVALFQKYLRKSPKAEDAAAIKKRLETLKKLLPPPGCQTDEECGAKKRCLKGKCVAKPPPRPVVKKCTKDGDCGEGKVCKEGSCVAPKAPRPAVKRCAKNADCGEGMVCKEGACVAKVSPRPPATECTKNEDCGEGKACDSGKCVIKTPPRPRPREVVLPPIQTKGLVLIDSKPQGAKIWLNDKMKPSIGKTPFQGSLPEGKYTVIVEKKGTKPEKREIEVSSQRIIDLYFALSREHYLGWLEITSNVPGAKVYIDDLSIGAVGRTPYSGFRKPGPHTIWVKKPGFKTVRRKVEIVSGETNVVTVKLKRVSYGWMDLSGVRAKGAKVRVDGKVVCKAPCSTVKVASGGHMLTVQREDHKPLKKTILIKKGQRTQVKVKLMPAPSRVSAYVSYGFAAVTLGGAIFTALKAKSIRDEVDKDIKNNKLITNKDDRYREGKIYSIVANGLFGVTAIAAAVGLYYQFRNPGSESSATFTIKGVSLTPEFGRKSVALKGRVRF